MTSIRNKEQGKRKFTEEPLILSEAGGNDPLFVRLRFWMASILILTNQVADRLIAAYDSLFSLDNDKTAQIYMGMGMDFAHDGNSEEALAALNKTLKMEPENGEAWFTVGVIHLGRHDPQAAVEALGKARALKKNGFEMHRRMAEAYADMGNHKAASKELKSAVKLNPDSAESFFRLGVSLDNLENYKAAAKSFQKAIDLSPREPAYYQSLGFTMESLDNHKQAVFWFKKAVELERRLGM